jgi:short-subunit dehydrogenase
MRDFRGRVAAITGAASGIGRALAEELAGRGCHLALADVDEDGLAETADRCATAAGAAPVEVSTRRVDVADRPAVVAWADRAVADHGKVDLVVNNAGVGMGAPLARLTDDDIEWLVGINFWGVVHGTRAFLPHLQAAGGGHLVNMSSLLGLAPGALGTAYCASKFAVTGFTESLRIELRAARSPVSCTTVHPGGVRTNIVRNGRHLPEEGDPETVEASAARFDKIALTSAPRAARMILQAVERDRRRVLVGPDAKAIGLVSRLAPGLYQRVAVAVGRREAGVTAAAGVR